jgi:hypothetical protein
MTEPIVVFTIDPYEFKVFSIYKNGKVHSYTIQVSSLFPERTRDESTYLDTINYIGPPIDLVYHCIDYAQNRAVKNIVLNVQGP